MMTNHSMKTLIKVVIALAICSCSTSPATPEATLLPSPTTNYISSATRLVISSPTPVEYPTPIPPPSTIDCKHPVVSPSTAILGSPLAPGMYIGFFVSGDRSSSLVIKSVEGHTVRLVPIPEGAYLPSPIAESGISPDGKYFVYYTGSPRWLEIWEEEPTRTFDITLHIATVSDGNDRASIRLVWPSFDDDLQQAAIDLATNPPVELEGESVIDIYGGLYDAFLVGITSVAWSPDGRYLAFAGAIEGMSSDIYLYDTESGKVNRLTSGPDEIVKIGWSPDGTWIMHGSARAWELGTSLTNHAVRFDGESVISFPFGGAFDRGWLSDHNFLANEGDNGIGSYDLAVLDIDNDRKISIWPGDFGSMAHDSMGSTILLSSLGYSVDSPGPGLYLINLSNGKQTKLADDPFMSIEYWPTSAFDFVATSFEGSLFGITPKGTVEEILPGDWAIDPSPSLTALALTSWAEERGLYILEDMKNPPLMLDSRDAYGVKWAPDSTWILYHFGIIGEEDISIAVTKPTPDSSVTLQVIPRRMCGFPGPEPVWIVVE